MIKRLRENIGLTQRQLADRLFVSDKAVSKWETGRGYPDVSLIEPLAAALGTSVIELISGDLVVNANRSFNMLKTKIYVCPLCGNVIAGAGEAVVSCCGITLPAAEAEEPTGEHTLSIERVEDEYLVSFAHEMTKTHYISFIVAVSGDGYELKKLYPEGSCEARFKMRGVRFFYYYCNRHGLFKKTVR